MTMRAMTAEELNVLNSLFDGDLQPLGELLNLERTDFHPLVQRALAKLIAGDEKVVDFKLVAEKHKAIRNKNMGVRAQARNAARDLEVARKLAEQAYFNGEDWIWKYGFESAIRSIPGVAASTAAKYWAKNEAHLRFCIAKGIIQQAPAA